MRHGLILIAVFIAATGKVLYYFTFCVEKCNAHESLVQCCFGATNAKYKSFY